MELKNKNYLLRLLILAVIFLLIRVFALGTVYVKGSSMENTLKHGDLLLLNKLPKITDSFEYNDIIVCKVTLETSNENIVKRIIAKEGDRVDIRENENTQKLDLYINDIKKEEGFEGKLTQNDIREFPIVVSEGRYFVMGDNRAKSMDSRSVIIGDIPKENILGKVFFRIYPLGNFGQVK